MNKNTFRIRARAGFTLVEVVTAMAIIAVCSAIVLLAYRATTGAMLHSSDLAHEADAAFALSQRADAARKSGVLTFSAGGKTYAVSGYYSYGEESGIGFHSFSALPGGRP